jgi:hypothetical protein
LIEFFDKNTEGVAAQATFFFYEKIGMIFTPKLVLIASKKEKINSDEKIEYCSFLSIQ